MSGLGRTFQIPSDMTCADESSFLRKIASFAVAGPRALHVVYDFDRTLTVCHPETQEDITTWHILGKHLSVEGQDRYRELFQKYRVLELEERLTRQDAIDWWSASFQLYVDEQVNMCEVDADFLARASIRPGTTELFGLCRKLGCRV